MLLTFSFCLFLLYSESCYRLVVFHSNEDEAGSLLTTKLQQYRRIYSPGTSMEQYRKYLRAHLKYKGISPLTDATSQVDHEW